MGSVAGIPFIERFCPCSSIDVRCPSVHLLSPSFFSKNLSLDRVSHSVNFAVSHLEVVQVRHLCSIKIPNYCS